MVFWAMQLASPADAFVALPQSNTASTLTFSSLHLLPSQANQLVAAYNAISVEKKVSEASSIKVNKDVADTTNKKSFLTRVFHLPSMKHPDQKKENDVVYYPMVGFRFFEGIDSVFPTTSHVSCMMPTKSQKDEEVYGWFSSSCKLDLFSDDVCKNPIGSDHVQ